MDERKRIVASAGGVYTMWVYISGKKKRSKWVKSWIAERQNSGHMTLLRHLRGSEPDDYKNYLRMSPLNFDQLLGK